jgi:ubiquinone/menaquinone biosynthesis C-methylase UbiE
MTNPPEPHSREYGSTYVVFDRNNTTEHQRLTVQDQMITAAMRGVLPEQSDPSALRRVLDVGCGTGNWIIETARTYPTIKKLYGIDVNRPMIEYAREQAKIQQVADRVEFLVMDALLVLEFPEDFFDLVNLRFGVSFIRQWEWRQMIGEMQRVSHPGGIIRVVDTELPHQSNSPALTQYQEMLQRALLRAGHLFEQTTTGLTAHLAAVLTQYGCLHVQTKPSALSFRAGTVEGQAYFEDVTRGMQTTRPFLRKWGCETKEFDAICKQAHQEMQRPDFCVTWNLLTVWGQAPGSRQGAYEY